MIKCNVTVCGTVSRQAQIRANKEGKQFISFGVKVVIPAKSGINKTIEISVAKDTDNQGEAVNYPDGTTELHAASDSVLTTGVEVVHTCSGEVVIDDVPFLVKLEYTSHLDA